MNIKKALKIQQQQQIKNEQSTTMSTSSLAELENLKRCRENIFEEEISSCLQKIKSRKIEFDIIDRQRIYEINKLLNENEELKEKNNEYEKRIREINGFVNDFIEN